MVLIQIILLILLTPLLYYLSILSTSRSAPPPPPPSFPRPALAPSPEPTPVVQLRPIKKSHAPGRIFAATRSNIYLSRPSLAPAPAPAAPAPAAAAAAATRAATLAGRAISQGAKSAWVQPLHDRCLAIAEWEEGPGEGVEGEWELLDTVDKYMGGNTQ